MKKIVLAAAIIAFGTTIASAQTTNSSTANATLNVVVANLKSISVSAGSTVNINLDNTAKFTAAAGTTGVNGNVVSTLDVVSNGAFKIRVSLAGSATALNNSATGATGITAIPANKIYLAVSNPRQIITGSTAPNATYANTMQNLINTTTNLIATPTGAAAASAGTSGTQYDVTYTLANYNDVASLAVGTFTGTVMYTITDL
ncbi:MAG: hypothetical protein EOP49_23925 [Sphingobacteriales bacterium]|nr:MAG: hypothetical protein EOP49_23925 [Sphingobacteriales bacterium]